VKNPAVGEADSNDQDLARWLEEAGRRVLPKGSDAEKLPAAPLVHAPAAAKKRVYLTHPRELLLFGIAALAYMPYLYADVYVQIYSMKAVLVFV
jgi:hypothetical protein